MKKNIKFLMVLLIGCLLFTGCGEKKIEGVDDKVSLKAPNNVKVETFYSIDNSNIILKLTNEGTEDISDLDILATYPTSQNDLITEDEIILKNLKANSTTYAALMLPINEDFNSYVPNKINLDIMTESENLEGIADTSQMVDLVKADYTVNDNVINFKLTNATGKILGSVSSVLVYFKDGKPIAADYVDALDVEDTFELERDVLYTGEEDKMNYIDYDNIEVYITSIMDDYVEEEEFDDSDEYDDSENEIIDDEQIEEDDDMSWDE